MLLANVRLRADQTSSGYFLYKTSRENTFARWSRAGNEEARGKVKEIILDFIMISIMNIQD